MVVAQKLAEAVLQVLVLGRNKSGIREAVFGGKKPDQPRFKTVELYSPGSCKLVLNM